MPADRKLGSRAIAGLLVIIVAAGCSRIGPQLRIGVDNTAGPGTITVTVESSGAGSTGGEDTVIPGGEGSAWSVPLGSTWEVKVDGKHVIGSGDPTDLALAPPGRRQDVTICIVAVGGTVKLVDGCWVAGARQPGTTG